MAHRNPMKQPGHKTPAWLRTCEGCNEIFPSQGGYLYHRKSCAPWLVMFPQE